MLVLIRTLGCTLALVFAFAASAVAQEVITFDHRQASADGNPDLIEQRTFRDGTQFVVRITNTCPSAFSYTVRALRRHEAETPPAPFGAGAKPAPPGLSEKTLDPITFDSENGGYLIDIQPVPGEESCVEYLEKGTTTPAQPQPTGVVEEFVDPADESKGVKFTAAGKEYDKRDVTLRNVTFTIAIRSDEWGVSIAGGFAASAPTDREFGLVSIQGQTGKFNLTEGARAHAAVGATTFIQVTKPSKPLGFAVGVGMGTNTATSYMFGPAIRFDDAASIVFGIALTPQRVLPPNVDDGATVDDPNFLNTLERKARAAVFVGFSFAILGSQQRFREPLGMGAAPGTGGSQ